MPAATGLIARRHGGRRRPFDGLLPHNRRIVRAIHAETEFLPVLADIEDEQEHVSQNDDKCGNHRDRPYSLPSLFDFAMAAPTRHSTRLSRATSVFYYPRRRPLSLPRKTIMACAWFRREGKTAQ
jgi:hypothetical protein